jgi:DNA polymerase eta
MFLLDFKFTKIRGLGGKLGDQITSIFSTDTVKDLLPVSVEQLKQKIGDDTGTWVFQIIRGIESSEVNSRTQIKSMLSAKSFRPSINTTEQAHRWLRIFAADIYSRLVEEGVLENKRRPKTMTIHFRHGGQTKSRQAPIALGRKIDETTLFELAKNLLGQIILEGKVWPCSNISLSVGGFEDGIVGNMGISSFLVKGDEAKAMNSGAPESSRIGNGHDRPEKRRRLEPTKGIQRFFGKADSTDEHDDDFGAHDLPGHSPSAEGGNADGDESDMAALPYDNEATKLQRENLASPGPSALHQHEITDYICSRCSQAIESADVDSHQDWHFAKDLHDQEKGRLSPRPQATTSKPNKKAGSNTSKKKPAKPEKGQSKLAFG